jgi:hypothetical protein
MVNYCRTSPSPLRMVGVRSVALITFFLFLAVQSIGNDPLSGLYGPHSSEVGRKSITLHDTVVCAMFFTLFINCYYSV